MKTWVLPGPFVPPSVFSFFLILFGIFFPSVRLPEKGSTRVGPYGRRENMNNEVQIGLVRVDGSMEAGSRPPEYFAFWEKERYCRLRPGPARARFLTGHLLVRRQLSQLCHGVVAPTQWRFCCNRYGKPDLDPAHHGEQLSFSLGLTQK